MKKSLSIAAAAISLLAASAAPASALVVEGEISLSDFDGDGEGLNPSIGAFEFDVTSAGEVTFDVLAYQSRMNPTLLDPVDTYSAIDTQLLLLNLDTLDVLLNDDGIDGADGSSGGFDPYLSANLDVGRYSVFVGQLAFDVDQALQGYGDRELSPLFGFQNQVSDRSTVVGSAAPYRLTITPVTASISAAVPAPAALPLLGMALAGLGLAARRRPAAQG